MRNINWLKCIRFIERNARKINIKNVEENNNF